MLPALVPDGHGPIFTAITTLSRGRSRRSWHKRNPVRGCLTLGCNPPNVFGHGYPTLTPAIKCKVFGLNAARVYGLQPKAMRCRLQKDPVQRRKTEYLNHPRPTFATCGPRDRAELLAFRRWQGELP